MLENRGALGSLGVARVESTEEEVADTFKEVLSSIIWITTPVKPPCHLAGPFSCHLEL